MSSSGEMIRAFKGEDTFSLLKNVKNPRIDQLISDLLDSEGKVSSQNDQSITDFVHQYLGQQGDRTRQAKQEVSTLDKFYDGGVENMLSDIRAARRQAYRTATDRGIDEIRKNRSLGFLSGDSVGSSYLDRIAMRQGGDAEIAASLDDVNQRKSDLNYLLGNQVNLAGRRGALMDSVLARLLTPVNLRGGEMARRIGNLGSLNQIEKSNTFYGLQKDHDTIDQVADFGNAFGSTLMDVASVYGGGSGGKQVRSGNPTNWDTGGGGGINYGGGGLGATGSGYLQMNGTNVPYSASPGVDYNPSAGMNFGGLA
jgi:hypothetical protein